MGNKINIAKLKIIYGEDIKVYKFSENGFIYWLNSALYDAFGNEVMCTDSEFKQDGEIKFDCSKDLVLASVYEAQLMGLSKELLCNVPMILHGEMITKPDVENDYLHDMQMCACLIDGQVKKIIVYAGRIIIDTERMCDMRFERISKLYSEFAEYKKALIGHMSVDGGIDIDTMIIIRESATMYRRLEDCAIFTSRTKYGMSTYETNADCMTETRFNVEKDKENFRIIQCNGRKNDYPVTYKEEDRFEIADNKIRHKFVISKEGTDEADIDAGYIEIGLNGEKIEVEVTYK